MIVSPTKASTGFTLVELVITIAILSIALLAVAKSLSFSAQFGSDSLWQTKTVALAQAYSDEILTKRFDEETDIGGGEVACLGEGLMDGNCTPRENFGPDGEIRSSFDDVDDYHELHDGKDGADLFDALGAERQGYSGYQVEIDVFYAGGNDVDDQGRAIGMALGDSTAAKLIRITVTAPGQTGVTFNAYRGNF